MTYIEMEIHLYDERCLSRQTDKETDKVGDRQTD